MSGVRPAVAGSLPFRWLSPAGRRARLSIFIFHRVLAAPDPLLPDEPDAARFEQIVAFLARNFEVLPLADAARRLAAGTLPAAAAAITFDDGYADNLEVAAPILGRHGLTATFFIATGYLDGGRMWNDGVIEALRRLPTGEIDWRDLGLGLYRLDAASSRRAAIGSILGRLKYFPAARRVEVAGEIARRAGLPARDTLMLTRDGLRALRALGMEIGGHTRTHPILRTLDEKAAADEIAGGRDELEACLGERPRSFAYPNGIPGVDYDARDAALVRRLGFTCAVSTVRGAAGRASDVYELPRFTPWDRTPGRFALRCADNLLRARWRPAVPLQA